MSPKALQSPTKLSSTAAISTATDDYDAGNLLS